MFKMDAPFIQICKFNHLRMCKTTKSLVRTNKRIILKFQRKRDQARRQSTVEVANKGYYNSMARIGSHNIEQIRIYDKEA